MSAFVLWVTTLVREGKLMRPVRNPKNVFILTLFIVLVAASAIAQDTWWVQSADYGAGNRRQDVTNTVRRLVNGPNFKVNNTTLGTDPFVGADKTLRIVAKDRYGKIKDFYYKEYSMVPSAMFMGGPNSGRPGWGNGGGNNNYALVITNARWGAGSRWMDVTSRLQGMIRNNRLSVKVTPQNMGGDPIHGTSKTLNVVYQFQGRRNNTSVMEGAMLNLP